MKSLLLVVLLVGSTTCLAQTVTVRVLNAKDGRPLGKEKVVVWFVEGKSTSAATNLETDANGETHFLIPSPAPEHVDVAVYLDAAHWSCDCYVSSGTRTLIEDGVVKALGNAKRANGFAREPGHVIVVGRPLTFLERLFYPLLRY
jgi:hypothetical protein